MIRFKNHTKIELTSKSTGRSTTILNTQSGVTGQVVAGIPITECVDNSLDSLVFTIKPAPKPLYEPFDVVTLTVSDEEGATECDMVVATDNTQSYQRPLNNYVHTVQLVELAKILEKIKIFNLNLTNTQDTLLRQFEKALNNAELLVSGASYEGICRFAMSTALIVLLEGRPSEDFWFGNTDLRTVLDTMLMSSNCRVTVEKIEFNVGGDISKIVIGYRSLSAATPIVPQWTRDAHGKIVNDEQAISCQDYAGKICATGKNSQIRSPIKITDAFKTASSIMESKTAAAYLPFPIGENGIKYFGVYRQCRLHDPENSAKHYYEFRNIDISSRLIPMEKFNILSEEESRKYLPYSIGSTVLPFGEQVKTYLWWTIPNIEDILNECAKEQISNYNDFTAFTDWYSCPFTCTYYPQFDTAAEITKPNTYDPDVLRMGIMSSQTENTLDIARHGKQLLSLAQRTGNAEWYIDVDATHYRRLLPLMSKIDDGYVLYKREVAIYDSYVKCRYYFSKDFNAVQAKAGVNRERHLYDIPLESDDCPLLLKQYMVFARLPNAQGSDATFKSDVIQNSLSTLLSKEAKKIKFILVKSQNGKETFPQYTENSTGQTPYSDDKYVFTRPTLNYAQAKAMNFVANVLDNYSVDYSRDGYVFSPWGDGGNKITYNRYVSKEATSVGECNRFELDFAFECKFLATPDAYKNYDELVKSFPVADSTEFEKATTQPFKINYYKDRTQRPVFFTSIECLPAKEDFDNLIIGTAFCRDNNLVTGLGVSDLKIYVSESETLCDGIDAINKSAYTSIGAPSDYFSIDGSSLRYNGKYTGAKPKSWAIANVVGELYLGSNGDLCDIYVHLSQLPYKGSFDIVFKDDALILYTPGKEAVEFAVYLIDFKDQPYKYLPDLANEETVHSVSFEQISYKYVQTLATEVSVVNVAFSKTKLDLTPAASEVDISNLKD